MDSFRAIEGLLAEEDGTAMTMRLPPELMPHVQPEVLDPEHIDKM